MNIKNTMAIVAGLAVSGMASAQTSVTVYGLVDLPVEHLTHTAPSGGGLTRMPELAGTLPSRLGFRGSEDLGGGLSANFVLEMGIAADNGTLNQGGRVFGRQSLVGLSGPWGLASAGRQYTMLFWALGDSDVMGPNLHSSGSFDPYLPNTRVDNSIGYRGTNNGFTVGATASLGRDTVNAGPSPGGTNCAGENPADTQACREWSAMLKYDTPAWGAAAVVDEQRGGPGAYAGLVSSAMKDRRVAFNGYVKFGPAKVGGGLIRRDNGASAATPRSDLWYLGVSYNVTPQVIVDVQGIHYDLKSSSNDGNLAIVRAMYSLSKRTIVYVSAAHMVNKGTATFSASAGQAGGNPSPGASQSAVAIGVRTIF